MPIALLTGLLLSVLALAATLGLGYASARGQSLFAYHLYLALFATLLSILAHSMTLFYFIGTGKTYREAAGSRRWAPEVGDRLRLFKRGLFPAISITILLTMTAFILGGGAGTGALPVWAHEVAAWAALAANVVTLALEVRYLVLNTLLGNEIAERLGA